MNDYTRLRVALQLIASGKDDGGTPLTRERTAAVAKMALIYTKDTAEEHIYLCGECPECGHPCKIDDETHYVGCSRMKVTP